MCQLHLKSYKPLGPILSFDQMYLYLVFCICTCLTSSFSKYASGRAVVGGAGGPDTIPHISPHTCPHYLQHFDFAHITTNTLRINFFTSCCLLRQIFFYAFCFFMYMSTHFDQPTLSLG